MKQSIRFTTIVLVFVFGCTSWGQSQSAPGRYWIGFSGKLPAELVEGYSTPFQIDSPEAFLSPRSLARRSNQNIAIQKRDLPISPDYISEIKSIPGVKVILTSRWFNAVTIASSDSTFDPTSLLELPFVVEVKSVLQVPILATNLGKELGTVDPDNHTNKSNSPADYGSSWSGIEQIRGNWLHGLGFRGRGLWIGVLDAGFEYVESLPVFKRAWQEGRIQEGLDAMQSQGGLFAHHRHGTSVLGTMAGFLEDSLIGTAPDATYVLYRTEDAYSEYLIEEDYWVVAAEHADSIGVDLINTSLGYSLFDDSTMNHIQEDLDGFTARISQAMTWASEAGILCVTSAGNSGNSPWHSITAPADAHGILSVGAVDSSGEHAVFSGWGPSADGRVKPEVMALGVQATYPHADSTIHQGNGTSFSSPILCGAAACLWQAFPDKTAADIRFAIIRSSHLFESPNDSMGYGIPDFKKAFELLDEGGAAPWLSESSQEDEIQIFPNPAQDWPLRWQYSGDRNPDTWRILSSSGSIMATGTIPSWITREGVRQGWIKGPSHLSVGVYLIQWLESDDLIDSRLWVWEAQ
jgi:hypothetical protein